MCSSWIVRFLAAAVVASTMHSFAAAADPTTAQLREQSTAVLQSKFDRDAAIRAEAFLSLTERKTWNYTDDNGAVRSIQGAYDSEAVRNDRLVLMFTTRQYLPVERLDAQGKVDLAEIGRLRSAVARDFQSLQTEIARQQAAEIERQRQAEMERQARENALKTRRARLLVDVDVPVVQGGVPTVLNLGAGEIFELVDVTPTAIVIRAGGQLVQLDPRVAREVEPQIVLKPAIGAIPGLPGLPGAPVAAVPPPKLDAKIGSYVFPDGRAALVIEDVAEGGLASRYGIVPGEVLERVNDVAVATLDEYREASLRGNGGLKLSLYHPPTNRSRVVVIAPPGAAAALGVVGIIDARKEFLISAVAPGSIAERLGLERDDKIIAVNGIQISTLDALRQVEQASGGRFTVQAVVDGVVRVLETP
jgi:hypothetical protein